MKYTTQHSVGDKLTLPTPAGNQEVEIVSLEMFGPVIHYGICIRVAEIFQKEPSWISCRLLDALCPVVVMPSTEGGK